MKIFCSLWVAGFILFMLGALTGCSNTSPTPIAPVTVVNQTQPVVLPPIAPPPDPQLIPFSLDVPRDRSKTIIKNISSCLNTPIAKQTAAFWTKCGTHPPIPNSNIFIGFDQQNFIIFRDDWAKLEAREQEWLARLEQINKERAASTTNSIPVK